MSNTQLNSVSFGWGETNPTNLPVSLSCLLYLFSSIGLETVSMPLTGRSWDLSCPRLVCSDTEKKHCLTPDSSLLILSVITLCTHAPAIIKVRMYSVVNRSMAGKSTCESAILPESPHVLTCIWAGMPDSPCESCSKHHSIPLPGKPLKYW